MSNAERYGFLPVLLLGRDGSPLMRGHIHAEEYPVVLSRGMHVYVREGDDAKYREQYAPPVMSEADVEELP